jgi:hypothetical protein
MRERGREVKKSAWVFLAVFLIYGACHLAVKNREVMTDTLKIYSPLAVNLAAGKGYVLAGQFYTERPPLYPLFMAGIYRLTGDCGTDNRVYPAVSIFLQVCTLFFLRRMAREVFPEEKAWLSFLIFAAYPFFVLFSVQKYVWTYTVLLTFLFFAAAVFFMTGLRRGGIFYFLSGLFLGLSALVWPGISLLWILFAAYACLFALRRAQKGIRVLGIALLIFAGFKIPVLCWEIQIDRHAGKGFLASNYGVKVILDGLKQEEGFKFDHFEFVRDIRAAEEKNPESFKTLKGIAAYTAQQLRRKPVPALTFFAAKLVTPWYAQASEIYDRWILWVQVPYLLLGIYGMRVCLKQKIPHTVFFMTVVAYFWFFAFLAYSILRYMIPVMGVWMLFVTAGLADLIARINHPAGERRGEAV